MEHLVSPSVLSADFGNLERDIMMLDRSRADWIHIDIMDGVFVPNISFGFPVLQSIRKYTDKMLDVHLMIVDPDRYFEAFKKAGADLLSVHYEACRHLHRSVTAIRQLGMKAGVVLNPHTPVSSLEDILTEVDLVLLMSVNPGYGGQIFIENTYARISRLRDMIIRKNASALIEVDGGVNLVNAQRLVEAGANVLVAGNTVFASEDPEQTIISLKSARPSE